MCSSAAAVGLALNIRCIPGDTLQAIKSGDQAAANDAANKAAQAAAEAADKVLKSGGSPAAAAEAAKQATSTQVGPLSLFLPAQAVGLHKHSTCRH